MIPIAPVKLSPVEPKFFLVESTNSKPLYDPFGKPLWNQQFLMPKNSSCKSTYLKISIWPSCHYHSFDPRIIEICLFNTVL